MNYIEEHHKYWEEGYKAAKARPKEHSPNPYEFESQHYAHNAWEAGYWWYAAQVH